MWCSLIRCRDSLLLLLFLILKAKANINKVVYLKNEYKEPIVIGLDTINGDISVDINGRTNENVASEIYSRILAIM